MSDDWPQGWYRGEGADAQARRPAPARGPSARGNWPEPPQGDRQGSGGGYGEGGRGGGGYGGGRGYGGGGYGGRTYGDERKFRFWGQPGRRGRRIFTIIVSVIIILILLIVALYFYFDGQLHRTVTLPTTTTQSAGENWLITGSDSRDGLSRTQRDALHVGSDMGTLNSDSIMLLHIGSGTPVLISIPRDSYVPIPGHGHNKLNATLGIDGGKPDLLIQTIESVTGLTINHYMGIGFGGLVQVTDAVGGVQMCLKTAVKDSYSGVNLKAGCQNLNGKQALAFVRDRHSFAIGDLQRIQDQRLFLSALLSKATSPGVYLNPFTALPFASSAASAMTVDKGTHLIDLLQVASALQKPQTGTVPISDPAYFTSAGEAVKWDSTKALQLFNALKANQPVPAGLLQGTQLATSSG